MIFYAFWRIYDLKFVPLHKAINLSNDDFLFNFIWFVGNQYGFIGIQRQQIA